MDRETEDSSERLPSLANGRQGALPEIESYDIQEEVGSGGFARIFRAVDTRTGRTEALKLIRRRRRLSDEVVQRFLREARALAAVDHENVVRIYHVIDSEGMLGLCMEFIEGQTLARRIEKDGPLRAGEVARIGVSVCRAIAEVHRAGFIHRDIKAENVMEEAESGRIVLMDFGVTRAMHPTTHLTTTGALVGTLLAMAPEQFELQDVDERTDIYALGCLLYFLATGKHAVSGTSVEDIREKVLAGSVTPLSVERPDFPTPLCEIVRHAMRPDPRRRFQSAAEMESKLQEWRESQAKAPRRSGPGRLFRTTVIFLLAGIFLALVGILLFQVYVWLTES